MPLFVHEPLPDTACWVGQGQPLAWDGVLIKLTYDLKGVPHEVEMPFVAARS